MADTIVIDESPQEIVIDEAPQAITAEPQAQEICVDETVQEIVLEPAEQVIEVSEGAAGPRGPEGPKASPEVCSFFTHASPALTHIWTARAGGDTVEHVAIAVVEAFNNDGMKVEVGTVGSPGQLGCLTGTSSKTQGRTATTGSFTDFAFNTLLYVRLTPGATAPTEGRVKVQMSIRQM